jgi:hypothetical protein
MAFSYLLLRAHVLKSYMVESTPQKPFSGSLLDFMQVEKNMMARRKALLRFLQPGEHLFSLVNFPRYVGGSSRSALSFLLTLSGGGTSIQGRETTLHTVH